MEPTSPTSEDCSNEMPILEPEWDSIWIESVAELKNYIPSIAAESIVCIDTETADYMKGKEKLCLIQLGLPSKEKVLLIDTLKITELSLLSEVFSNPSITFVAHNMTFEKKQLKRHGLEIVNLEDTMKIAKQLRKDLPNHTLKACCKYLLGLDISKVEQVSDWSVRPLTPSQLKYAALDAELGAKLFLLLRPLLDATKLKEGASVPDLMQELSDLYRERIELTRSISDKLCVFNAKEEIIREALKERLINGEDPFEGECGRCSLSESDITEVSADLVRSFFPQFADLVIREVGNRKVLKELFEENDLAEEEIEKVLVVVSNRTSVNVALS